MDNKNQTNMKSSLHPETLSLGLGYNAFLSEGSVKVPLFMTSTFKFKSAEEGKRHFDLVYGKDTRKAEDVDGLVYSRLNNPNLQIFEERMAVWDGAEKAAVFSSGMSAISTTMFGVLKPGDHVLVTMPVYGGTYFLFEKILSNFGMKFHFIPAGTDCLKAARSKIQELGADKIKAIYVESPSNPSNVITDIRSLAVLKDEVCKQRNVDNPCLLIADNTFLGPVFQKTTLLGADITLYSATKFIGGHSDLIAGVVAGGTKVMEPIFLMRTILGTMADPHTCWMLSRSLETLAVRMEKQAQNAQKVAELLVRHPFVFKVTYPGLLKEGETQYDLYKSHCSGPGSMITFDVKDIRTGERASEEKTFKVLNAFKVFGLAVSLGGTESLVEHPMSMTHADVPEEELVAMGVFSSTIRVSVGIEYIQDLLADLTGALGVLEEAPLEKICNFSFAENREEFSASLS